MTERQRTFARFYAADPLGNKTQAAIKAGCPAVSAPTTAYKWLKKAEVQAEIARFRQQTETKLDISAEKVIQKIAEVAFLDIRKLFAGDGSLVPIKELPEEVSAAVAGIEHEKLFEHFGKGQAKHVGTTTKVKLSDRLRALELLGRWHKLKLFEENITVKGDEALIAALAQGRKRLSGSGS